MRALVDGGVVDQTRAVDANTDGVFRTLLVWGGVIVDAAAQHAVLQDDARRLGLTAAPLAIWQADSLTALDGEPRAALRWSVVRAAAGSHPVTSRRRVAARPLPPDRPSQNWTRGVHADVSPVRLMGPPTWAGIKHLDRSQQRQGARGWSPDQAEALMCDDAGHLVCGTRSNLFWVSQGELFTPPLDRVGVRGLMHRKIEALADALGLRLSPRRVRPEQLNDAEELFVTNSLIGLWPVRSLGPRQWRSPGPVTRKLLAALQHPLADHMRETPCVG